ncbi:7tm odorant receptor domain-containing protein [Phthorimaea operculella]|nr:7tm odorant receptor domain-containing protein [Phthorimaea operculella]
MRFNRTHPNIPRDGKWFLQFLVMHGVATFVVYLVAYSTICHDFKNNNFTQASENFIIICLYWIVTFCYFMMLWKLDSVRWLIDAAQKDFAAAKYLPAAEQEMLMGYALRGRWSCRLWLVISCCVATIFPLRSFCLMVYYSITDEFRLIPLYEVVYPEFLEKDRENLLSFVILFATMLWLCVYAASLYVALIPLGHIFMLHACGQIELLINRAGVLFPKINYNSSKAERDLKGIARGLQDVYSFVDHVQWSFQLIYELCLKSTTITMPLLVYELTKTTKHGEFNMEFFAITIGSVVLSGVPCFYSDQLMELSYNFRQTLYCSGWERHWDSRARTILLMMLVRTGRPAVIRSMFGNMSLRALGNDSRARTILLMILVRTGRPAVIRSMFGNMSLRALGNVSMLYALRMTRLVTETPALRQFYS